LLGGIAALPWAKPLTGAATLKKMHLEVVTNLTYVQAQSLSRTRAPSLPPFFLTFFSPLSVSLSDSLEEDEEDEEELLPELLSLSLS